MNYESVEEDRDITGLFWYRKELTFNGQRYKLRVKFADNKNLSGSFAFCFKIMKSAKNELPNSNLLDD